MLCANSTCDGRNYSCVTSFQLVPVCLGDIVFEGKDLRLNWYDVSAKVVVVQTPNVDVVSSGVIFQHYGTIHQDYGTIHFPFFCFRLLTPICCRVHQMYMSFVEFCTVQYCSEYCDHLSVEVW